MPSPAPVMVLEPRTETKLMPPRLNDWIASPVVPVTLSLTVTTELPTPVVCELMPTPPVTGAPKRVVTVELPPLARDSMPKPVAALITPVAFTVTLPLPAV